MAMMMIDYCADCPGRGDMMKCAQENDCRLIAAWGRAALLMELESAHDLIRRFLNHGESGEPVQALIADMHATISGPVNSGIERGHCEYIRRYYGVPAQIGGRIKVNGRPGVIVEDRGARLGVQYDDAVIGSPAVNVHPTYEVEYLEGRKPTLVLP